MDLFTVDFETFYDTKAKYSLTHMSTEEYVTDPRFEIILVGLKKNTDEPTWFSSPNISDYDEFLGDHGVYSGGFLAHNTMFDALITQHHFGRTSRRLFDTLSMAQAIEKPYHRSISLDSLLKRHDDLGLRKLGTVHQMNGMRLSMITPQHLKSYAEYCMIDCEGCFRLFRKWLKRGFPKEELDIIDLTLRMYLEPQLELDGDIFEEVRQKAVRDKERLINKLPEDITPTMLRSNPQFAKLLEKYGIEPPMKISPTTDKPTFAFAKNDVEWIELEEAYEDDPIIGPLMAARKGVKSSLAETRAERLRDIGWKYKHFRVPLGYYRAHTGRYGGKEKINPQNFTRTSKKGGRAQLRYGIKAPKGYVVMAPDLSQIEARINAWNSNCKRLIQVFAEDGDPYKDFATVIFRKPTDEINSTERFVGKTCILGLGYGMGPPKLRATLMKDPDNRLIETEGRCKKYVYTYRDTYHEIPSMWRFCDQVIQEMATGGRMQIGRGPLRANGKTIELPNGMVLAYPRLRHVSSRKYTGWVYEFAGQGRTLWGGKVVENYTQALARIIIMENMRAIKKELSFRPALQAHDELVYVIPVEAAEEVAEQMTEIMARRPWWAPDLPVKGEIEAWGESYGDCK